MGILPGFDGWPDGALHLAIGVFDGVHLGHQALIRRLRDGAAGAGALPVATTFDPLPIQVLAPGAPPSALSDADERAALLSAAGADAVVLFRSDPAFFAMTAREFVDRVAAAGDVRRIVVGPDFRFGHRREGDVRLLTELAPGHGASVDVVGPIELGGAVVSSTRIRNLLVDGDVTAAAELLGRPYSVRGHITDPDERGRALGYPTTSVTTVPERLLPRDGIYATWVAVGAEEHAAAVSLGVRPAVGAGERVLEAFFLDRPAEAPMGEAVVTFVERLRDELRFESAGALVAQIARDVEAARDVLIRRDPTSLRMCDGST